MTHTETPWQVKHDWDAEGATTIVANVDGDTDADGSTSYTYDTIARCSDEFEELLPNAAANARHIVHCVNTHDALVKALEGCIPSGVCLTNSNIPDDTIVPIDATMGELRAVAAALALAKGEGE